MDIDFILHDTYGLLRPQWKITTALDEAGRLFADSVAQNYKNEEVEKAVEQEEPEDDTSSVDGEGDELPAEAEDGESSNSEAEGEVLRSSTFGDSSLPCDQAQPNGEQKDDSHFEPAIVVKRQEEERDPEAEADFDRELAKMMAESIDSRKFERKQHFDVPLPIRKGLKDQVALDDEQQNGAPTPASTMAFALMTKRGNKQQVKHFAVILPLTHTVSRLERSSCRPIHTLRSL